MYKLQGHLLQYPATLALVTKYTSIDRNLWLKVSFCQDDVYKRAYSLAFFMIL